VKPADVEDDEDVARLLSNEVMSGVYQFRMPDHGGSDTSEALAIQGGDKTPLQETIFCNEKRPIMTKFIFSALVDDPSIAWTELCVNSADYLLNGRKQWRWYQAKAEGYQSLHQLMKMGGVYTEMSLSMCVWQLMRIPML
jgi:hypothetical protein